MNKAEYDYKSEELGRLIKSYCNTVGCSSCIHVRYNEDGKELGECKATDLNTELILTEIE